jgi:hypothetical protein
VSGGEPVLVSAEGGAIAVDDSDLYVATVSHVVRVPRDGSPSSEFSTAGATAIALDDTFVYLAQAGGVRRVAKSDPAQVVTLSPADYTHGYWWSPDRIALGPADVFFLQHRDASSPVCVVTKDGANAQCTKPIQGGRALSWNGALYFESSTAIEKLVDVTTSATSVIAAAERPTLWVDESSVWWLTKVGDLYRVDK